MAIFGIYMWQQAEKMQSKMETAIFDKALKKDWIDSTNNSKFELIDSLNLSNNALLRIPENVFYCSNLFFLNLGYNNFETLPPEIGKLTNLTYLNLRANDSLDISSLCNAFEKFPKEIIISTDYDASNDDSSILLIRIPKQNLDLL